MPLSNTFEGFRLAYDRTGRGQPVVLLHGWPGDRTDYNRLVPLIEDQADILVPDLRGFGGSDKHPEDPERFYSGAGQARAVAALMDELGIRDAVVAGYDVGSFVAQTLAAARPDLVRALVVSPPIPGGGRRVLGLTSVKEFWYTSFQQLALSEQLVDGRPDAVRAYLQHFWNHWSGPDYSIDEERLDHLAGLYSAPGAFTASVAWYRSTSNPVTAYASETEPSADGRLGIPTTILWQEHDPIFPLAWSDRIDSFFERATLRRIPGVGHFTPIEAAPIFAEAIKERLTER